MDASLLVAYDLRNGTDLVRTAWTLVEQQGDLRATARALAIHPNTLKYRLKRIEQIG